jgi:acyl carrier protein
MIDESEICDELTKLFCEVFVRSDMVLSPDTTAADVPGWDSFKHIEIILAVEEKFDIKFSTREVDGLNSVADLVRAVTLKV